MSAKIRFKLFIDNKTFIELKCFRIWLKIESSHTFPKNLNKTNIQTIQINETGVTLLPDFVTYMFHKTWLILEISKPP